MEAVYLDNNSTTRPADNVLAAMWPFLSEQYGNPSSLHLVGQTTRHAVELAREKVAALIGARPREIIFTSGGTESDNLAILGALAAAPRKRRIVTTAVEHVAVYGLCERLAKQGCHVTYVGVDERGRLDLDALESAVEPDTALVSVMHVNNETGVIFPIREVAEITRAKGVPLHVDAVQSAGKMPVDVDALGVDALSLSAHKMYGLKGVGALYVGRGLRLRGQLVGGHQERGLRPGTENVLGIIAFGAAADLARKRLTRGWGHVQVLRDRLERDILERFQFVHRIGDPDRRISNTANIAFEALEAEAILIGLSEQGVCASSGSACSSGSLEPSHVIRAMGVPERIAHGAVRFSLSWDTTESEIERAVAAVSTVVGRLASLSTSP